MTKKLQKQEYKTIFKKYAYGCSDDPEVLTDAAILLQNMYDED